MKKCPRCGAEMNAITLEDLPLDQCPNGHGMWFDSGELDAAIDKAEPDLDWMEVDLWKDPAALQVSHDSDPCPVCQETMAVVTYDDTDVQVDVCLHKHGVWLDQGELEKISAELEQKMLQMGTGDLLKESLAESGDVITGGEGRKKERKSLGNVVRLLQYRILVDNPRLDGMFTGFMRTRSGGNPE